MGKTYRSEYTVKKGNALAIAGAGNYLIVRVNAAAPEGKLMRFSVRQVAGTAVGFTVDWLESMVGPGLVPGEFNPGTNPLPAAAIMDMYRIRPATVATAGVTANNLDKQNGESYSNQDTNFSNRPREIYMVLQPAVGAPAATTWELTVTTQNTVG